MTYFVITSSYSGTVDRLGSVRDDKKGEATIGERYNSKEFRNAKNQNCFFFKEY